ncbi:class I SAM-dependent methyltransferase [Rhizobium sp. LjRoot254]|uniref:class I SAM-dependent methyltransferase n=1 Tax=Rhizobium sp. LjRoot254 TaxID=3342297 RepID=UPI003F4F7A2B
MSIDLKRQWPEAPDVGESPRSGTAAVPIALSQTHRHLLTIVNTELARRALDAGKTIRLLDVGCGDGLLLVYLSGALQAYWPAVRFEFYGFDVGDHGVQAPGFIAAALERLERDAPSGRWHERLALISESDDWPYSDGFFDVVVSNQVLEHVRNHNLFFMQLTRVLSRGGFSAHIYPSGHRWVEPHTKVPFAHWIKDFDLLSRWLAVWSRMGLSTYHGWARARREAGLSDESSIDAYARYHAYFLVCLTNYKTQREMHDLVKASGQLSSFRYTLKYYTGKLRSLRGKEIAPVYGEHSSFRSHMASLCLRYVSSVTLMTRKDACWLAGERASTDRVTAPVRPT